MFPDETLSELRSAVVPAFADAVLIHLCERSPTENETPDLLILLPHTADRGAHAEAAVLDSTRTGVPQWSSTPIGSQKLSVSGPLAELLRAGLPILGDTPGTASWVKELLDPAVGGPKDLPSGERVIIAPLVGRRQVIGVALLIRGPDQPPFCDNDLLVASQLATHTALSMDRLEASEQDAVRAAAIQRTMLPVSLPELSGVRLASRYLSAAETSQVGGDWYDAMPLPGNRVALVIGDVMGHSMTSAAIMGQLRTTVQTLAGLDLPPEEILYHLDEQAQRLSSQHIATCLYAIYDPIAQRLQLANAGHPPPILVAPDGGAKVLQVPPGPPIGVGGLTFETVELYAPVGATLILYTDGLVETRTRDVWTGLEFLRDQLQAAGHDSATPPEMLCDAILRLIGPTDQKDDVALLAARFDGIAAGNVAYWYLAPHPQAASRARRLTRKMLLRWQLESMVDSTELMVSEVVTNASRYASRPLWLRLIRTSALRCEVGDDSPYVPRMRHAQLGDEGGRGLFLVNQLARHWGATRLSTGKMVWFEQALPDTAKQFDEAAMERRISP
ncbi:SpoIIE family protein phosphatase [Streptomyces sp. NPDC020681]|uniref:SpoIIE family protein phosphatase n=1 Tax=Streptomyces sp. NPDC020681 TaxID=3365083 RepID=UPI00379E7BBB